MRWRETDCIKTCERLQYSVLLSGTSEVSWSEIKMFLTLLFNKLTSFLHYTFIDKEKSCFKIFELIFLLRISSLETFFSWKIIKMKKNFYLCRFFNHEYFFWKGWEVLVSTKILILKNWRRLWENSMTSSLKLSSVFDNLLCSSKLSSHITRSTLKIE